MVVLAAQILNVLFLLLVGSGWMKAVPFGSNDAKVVIIGMDCGRASAPNFDYHHMLINSMIASLIGKV